MRDCKRGTVPARFQVGAPTPPGAVTRQGGDGWQSLPQRSRYPHKSKSEQIPLALDYAPVQVREHGLRDAHWRPLAAWSKDGPSFRTSAQLAWQFPLLELGRTPNTFAAVILDVDGREAVMVAPRRRLALVCFLHQARRDTLDQAVDMYAKLLERSRKLVQNHLDAKLKAQRHAVDRIVPRYRGMGEVLLDPDINDTELRARLFAVVSESELREDHTDLAHWTRGDRKARFRKMAERHAALSRFAAPFWFGWTSSTRTGPARHRRSRRCVRTANFAPRDVGHCHR